MSEGLAVSILARLRRLARERGEDPQLVLVRYVNERLLYRLSIAAEAGSFVLKGGTLFLVWFGRIHRVTRDIDLLGRGSPEPHRLEALFRSVCALGCDQDGVVFDPVTVTAREIREGASYGGVRVRLRARLGKADVPVQVDVGFGDVVIPPAELVEIPALLDMPAARLMAYPWEASVAEKVHALVVLGRDNSRMKDLHDAWWLLRQRGPSDVLEQAVRATFERRGTVLPTALPDALSDTFAADPVKQAQWRAFLARSRVEERPELGELIRELRVWLSPALGLDGAVS